MPGSDPSNAGSTYVIPLEVRMSQCQHCYADHKPDQRIFICSRCKRTRYCDANCQRQNWKLHKKLCRPGGMGIGHTSFKDDPSCPYTWNDFGEFMGIHRPTMGDAAVHAMKAYNTPPLYDESDYCLVVFLEYEPTRRDNPKKRFSLAQANVVNFDRVHEFVPRSSFGAELRAHRVDLLTEARKSEPTIRQFLNILVAGPYRMIMPAQIPERVIKSFIYHPILYYDSYQDWMRSQFTLN